MSKEIGHFRKNLKTVKKKQMRNLEMMNTISVIKIFLNMIKSRLETMEEISVNFKMNQ